VQTDVGVCWLTECPLPCGDLHAEAVCTLWPPVMHALAATNAADTRKTRNRYDERVSFNHPLYVPREVARCFGSGCVPGSRAASCGDLPAVPPQRLQSPSSSLFPFLCIQRPGHYHVRGRVPLLHRVQVHAGVRAEQAYVTTSVFVGRFFFGCPHASRGVLCLCPCGRATGSTSCPQGLVDAVQCLSCMRVCLPASHVGV
jgi:hypothetical protein